MEAVYETEHLSVDFLGVAWFGHIQLGLLEDDPTWPTRRLGIEPTWFDEEMAELHEQHADALGNDTRPEADAAFCRANQGLTR